ncbi:MAG: hypothetical protein AAF063_00790 [Cyanobacteria bacterium J06643_5]
MDKPSPHILKPHPTIMLKKTPNPFTGASPPSTNSQTITNEQFRRYELEAQFRRSKAAFPPTEILEAGDVMGWLQLHVENLLEKSQQNRMHGGFTQLLGLSAGLVSFLSTGTAVAPLAPVAITLGLLGYGASVADSAFRLGRVLPIPFSSFTLQKLAQSTSADGRQALKADADDDDQERFETMAFLPYNERRELEMLVDYQGMMLELLSNVPEGKRFAIYYVLRQAYVDGGFKSKNIVSEINKLVESVSPDSSLDQHLMHDIKQRLALLPYEDEAQGEEDIFGFGASFAAPSFMPAPTVQTPDLPASAMPTVIQDGAEATYHADSGEEEPISHDDTQASNTEASTSGVALQDIPLSQRAQEVVKLLVGQGFHIDQILSSQITAIAGAQRGGKGTLAGILAILSKAADPNLTVEYYSAGIDIYPFKCQLTSALDYSGKDMEAADTEVARKLLQRLKELESTPPYSQKNLLLVIDEAMRLFSLMSDEDRTWAVIFLLTRFAKTGAGLVLVLHSNHLGAVVGSKNTSGMAATFKDGVNFIGCESQQIKTGLLTSTAVASGRYFKANPNNFGQPVKDGELGEIPNWLKTEKHPGNGQPDPVRTLLALFPELRQEHQPPQEENPSIYDVGKFQVTLPQEQDTDSPKVSDKAAKVLAWLEDKTPNTWFYYRKSGSNERDASFQKFLSRLELCGDDQTPEDIFLELMDAGLADVSDDGYGIKRL